MNQRIRIKDIADKAGVSAGTVDRVIHNRGNVSPKTKQKVLRVMEGLGYEPNIIASTLAYNRIFRIAVLLPDFRKDIYWEQPKLGVERAQRTVQHYGVEVDIFYFDSFDTQSFLDRSQEILHSQRMPDAILFAPLLLNESKILLAECKALGIPNVMINTNIDNSDSLCYIGQDSYQSGVLGGRLLNFGLHDGETALILNLDKSVTNAKHLIDKEKGFRDYFANIHNKKIEIIREVFEEFNHPGKLRAFLRQIMEAHPRLTGIFVTNSRAYKVVECLDEADLKRVKIVGYDLIEPNLNFLLSNKINFIINQNPVQQGYLGIMNIVNHLILKKDVDPLQYLPLDIVVVENFQYYLKKEQEFQIVV